MGKIYNVVLDSGFPYANGATLSSQQFYVNWQSILPDCEFKMSFSFISTAVANYTNTNILGLGLNLGGNKYVSSQALTKSDTTQFAGFISAVYQSPTATYFYSDTNTNPPVYLKQRPNQNIITAQLCNGIDTTSSFASPVLTKYILILSFEALNELPQDM